MAVLVLMLNMRWDGLNFSRPPQVMVEEQGLNSGLGVSFLGERLEFVPVACMKRRKKKCICFWKLVVRKRRNTKLRTKN